MLIRAPQPGDGAQVYEAIAESLDELRPWMPWAHGAQSAQSTEEYVRQAHADFVARRNLAFHLYRR